MGILEKLGKGLRRDEDFRAAQKQEKINKIIEARKKSSNERILEAEIEKQRQEMINQKVKEIAKRRNDELFNKPFQPTPNIFHRNNEILKVKPSILKSNENPVLRTRNIFFR